MSDEAMAELQKAGRAIVEKHQKAKAAKAKRREVKDVDKDVRLLIEQIQALEKRVEYLEQRYRSRVGGG